MKKENKIAFGKKIYLLGSDAEGVRYWLEAPSWDCGWYWGFGYVETYTNNKNPERARDVSTHQHFDGLFLKKDIFNSYKKLLINRTLSDKEIWQLLELMRTFYTLKESAELFGRGGSHITENPSKEILKNKEITEHINKKLIPEITKKVIELLSE